MTGRGARTVMLGDGFVVGVAASAAAEDVPLPTPRPKAGSTT